MNQGEILEKGLEALLTVGQLQAGQQGAAAERLEALSKVTATIPWEEVATLSIGWRTVEYKDGESGGIELLPELHVVMKEQQT